MKLNELNKEDEMKEVAEENNYYTSLLDFYLKHNQKVHMEMKNGRFYNGAIGEIFDDSFILTETSLGEMPIFFSRIKVMEAFKER